jgi:hypothetical protein
MWCREYSGIFAVQLNMKKLFDIARLSFFSAIAVVFLAASAGAADKTNYITAPEITSMAPCTATFARRLSEFSGFFTNAEGKAFILGDIAGTQEVWHFVGALKEGQTYKFPETFTNYLAAAVYVTPKEIAGMVPCTGTLASRSPCSSIFSTPDGKWFVIGDPGSEGQVTRFIWSLKDSETCRFPDVFLKFQTNSPSRKP